VNHDEAIFHAAVKALLATDPVSFARGQLCLGQRADGLICLDAAIDVLGPFPMCRLHRRITGDAFRNLMLLLRQADVEEAERRAQQLEMDHVVYLLLRGDCTIKIGFTSQLRKRWSTLQREHGPLRLVGLCRGSRLLEGALHERFQRWRIGTSEWFLPAPRLLWFSAGCRYRAPFDASWQVPLAPLTADEIEAITSVWMRNRTAHSTQVAGGVA
jgi:hypothetical protein